MSDKTREDVEILGVNHTLAIDPDSLNEAGVVWAPAVRALASAIAPIVVAEAEARRYSSAVASSWYRSWGKSGCQIAICICLTAARRSTHCT